MGDFTTKKKEIKHYLIYRKYGRMDGNAKKFKNWLVSWTRNINCNQNQNLKYWLLVSHQFFGLQKSAHLSKSSYFISFFTTKKNNSKFWAATSQQKAAPQINCFLAWQIKRASKLRRSGTRVKGSIKDSKPRIPGYLIDKLLNGYPSIMLVFSD